MSFSFHLCQPGEGASCGACCGLYNFQDHSRERLTKTLSRRTQTIRELPKNPESYRAAARSLRRWDKDPLFAAVRVCPLLGFVDEEERQVGCLAHPAVTGGVDLRDCGAYNASTCQSFECPSFLWLNEGEARLVRAACPDWYLYGLVITDVELVRGSLRLLDREMGGKVDPMDIVRNPLALSSVAGLFEMKEKAPDRPPHGGIFGRFERDVLGEPGSRILDYQGLGVEAEPEDDVVLCLGYDPEDAGALFDARARVAAWILGAARALRP